jgi:poly-gamma-glutamate synthesis protein (capsule biosynthesis protein)
MSKWTVVAGCVWVCILGVVIGYAPRKTYNDAPPLEWWVHVEAPKAPPRAPATRVLFVGDIMLGRGVESLMEEYGMEYPFQNVRKRITEASLSVGNLEGIVSEKHIHTPSMTFQFSIRSEYLSYVHAVGIDVLSLANNHSNDYGDGALAYTRALCIQSNLLCGGGPTMTPEYSTVVTEVHGKKIGLFFLQTVTQTPAFDDIMKQIMSLRTESDIQIAYVHWGDEYALTHNVAQELLAKKLIDSGIDAVIGLHPHVVQDIGMYKGKPIFYSLGNFIFDQYFSTDVQEGIAVLMDIDDTKIVYSLLGHTSIATRAQPVGMSAIESQILFSRILTPIMKYSEVDAKNGTITISQLEA